MRTYSIARTVSTDAGTLQILGPQLTLRFATPADVSALFELGRDPVVTRFFSWGPYREPAEAAAYVESLARRRHAGELLEFLIVRRGEGPIGVTGLSERSVRDRRAVVGSWLGRRWWGSGANAEAKALVTALAFGPLGLQRLGAYADVENARSRSALARLGFREEGVLRAWHRHGERVRDVVVYGLLRAEWERSALAAVPVEIRGEPPAAWLPPAGAGAQLVSGGVVEPAGSAGSLLNGG